MKIKQIKFSCGSLQLLSTYITYFTSHLYLDYDYEACDFYYLASSSSDRAKVALLTSPHVFKKFKEGFSYKTHSVLMTIPESMPNNAIYRILANRPQSISIEFLF